MNRLSHSVLEVASRLHGAICGSGDGMVVEEMSALTTWLEYRLHEGWTASPFRETQRYDEAIRELGAAALAEARHFMKDL